MQANILSNFGVGKIILIYKSNGVGKIILIYKSNCFFFFSLTIGIGNIWG